MRRKHGWSLEEALTGKKKPDPVIDHLGNEYKSKTEMCKAYGVRLDVYCQRRKRGWSLEEALTGKKKGLTAGTV